MTLNLALRLGCKGGAAGKTLTFLQGTADAANASVYTFTAQNLGAAASDRRIIVSFGARAVGGTAMSVSSITVGGISATINAQTANTSADVCLVATATAHVPTGTSGDIVVTVSRSCVRAGITVYSASGLTSEVASDSDTSTAVSPATSSVTIPSGGFMVGFAVSSGASAATWSGLTEDFDGVSEGTLVYTSASSSTVGTPSVSAVMGGSAPVGVFVAW